MAALLLLPLLPALLALNLQACLTLFTCESSMRQAALLPFPFRHCFVRRARERLCLCACALFLSKSSTGMTSWPIIRRHRSRKNIENVREQKNSLIGLLHVRVLSLGRRVRTACFAVLVNQNTRPVHLNSNTFRLAASATLLSRPLSSFFKYQDYCVILLDWNDSFYLA